ncbi:MAG: phosphodiester glycosidase family protein [Flavisolibacter sp.]|jgi:exopolysaccharide biosynthesis protein|nr:phosphodiester glycosidase family protein [Flavisolibacter sp.]
MMRIAIFILCLFYSFSINAQLQWKQVNHSFGELPASINIFFTDQKIDTAPFRAYYVIVDLGDRALDFTTDTTWNRRLKPSEFHERHHAPLLVVNGTFFSFQTNRNLNLVMKDGNILSHNPFIHRKPAKDTIEKFFYSSAIGITAGRQADIAWVMTDSTENTVYATQVPTNKIAVKKQMMKLEMSDGDLPVYFEPWAMHTSIGGGPVLIQNGNQLITNNEERKFGGKGLYDKHPRTAMGYTADGKLVILAVEGRNPEASGASLPQLAGILQELGCIEAMNLDGGGSSCLLVNGKETIRPSDKEGQRPVPAVFMIKKAD